MSTHNICFLAKIRKISFHGEIRKLCFLWRNKEIVFHGEIGGWCEGAVYLTSLGRPTDIGLQLGKACYPCSG